MSLPIQAWVALEGSDTAGNKINNLISEFNVVVPSANTLNATEVTFAGNMTLDAVGATDTTLTIQNSGAGVVDVSIDGDLVVTGDLTINGATTTVNTATLDVEDKNILVNKGGTTAGSVGAGLTIEGDASAVVGYVKVADADNSLFAIKAPTGNVLTLDVNADKSFTIAGALAVEADSTINQDLSSDASVTFAGATLSGLSNGLVKSTTGVLGTATATDIAGSITWGDGLSLTTSTASVDYNTTNLKMTTNQLDTIQSIATTASPTFANLTDSGLTITRVPFASTSGLLVDSANMVFDATNGLKLGAGSASALNLTSTAGTAVGGLLFGSDTNLYRSGANIIKTDDEFHALTVKASGSITTLDANVISVDISGGSGRIVAVGADATTAGTMKFAVSSTDGAPYYTPFELTAAGDCLVNGDIYTVQIVDYSATSTITGFSTIANKVIKYKKLGKTVHIWYWIDGTSDGTTGGEFKFTMPFNGNLGMTGHWPQAMTMDNGAFDVSTGRIYLPDNTGEFVLTRALGLGGWTTSGQKLSYGYICVEVAT